MPGQDYIRLLSALLADDVAAVAKRVQATNFEFEQFRAFTDIHQLSGYLFLHIKGGPLEGLFPPEQLEYLGGRYALQRQRCDEILLEAAHIQDTFKAAHQSVLFLKGLFVAQQFYGDMHQRFHWDIDILVPREDVLAADQLLRGLGYGKLSLVLVGNNAMTRFTHTYDYHKRIAGPDQSVHRQYLPLDLHWSLRSHFSFCLEYENIWKQHEECQLQGRSFPVLSTEYALVMNVLGIFCDIELGTTRLKSFLDLYKMLDAVDSGMDWDAFFEQRTNENIFRIVLNVIDLLLDVLECRNRFTRAASFVERHRSFIRLGNRADKYRLLERSRFSFQGRLWAHALYQAPVLQPFLWTMISLPFRIAAHERKLIKLMGRM